MATKLFTLHRGTLVLGWARPAQNSRQQRHHSTRKSIHPLDRTAEQLQSLSPTQTGQTDSISPRRPRQAERTVGESTGQDRCLYQEAKAHQFIHRAELRDAAGSKAASSLKRAPGPAGRRPPRLSPAGCSGPALLSNGLLARAERHQLKRSLPQATSSTMMQDREPRAQLLPPDAVCTPSCGQTRPGHPLHPARGSSSGRAPAQGSQGGSQGALQRVVVVLEALQLQEVFGTFALLAGRQVGDLDGGGAGDFRGEGEVLRCRLVLPLAAASPGLGPAGIEKAPSPVLLSPERPLNPHVCLSGMRQVCPQDTALTVVLQSKAGTSLGARPGARTRFPAHSGQHKQERGLRPDLKPRSARTDGLPGAR